MAPFHLPFGLDALYPEDPPRRSLPTCPADHRIADSIDNLLKPLVDLTFPDPEDPPADSLQAEGLSLVALHVARQLCRPVVWPRTWPNVVTRTPMPEATVNEDRDLRSQEDQVGPTGRRLRVLSVAEPSMPKGESEAALRARV